MPSKVSVAPIVKDHLATLRDASTGKPRLLDWLLVGGVPLAVGAVALARGFTLTSIADLGAMVAVLAGLLFALVIFVFQLRLQVAHDPRVHKDSVVVPLIDELFANVMYAVVVGLVDAALVMLAANTRVVDSAGTLQAVNVWWSAGIAVVTAHWLLTILMCLKRTRSAYARLAV